MKGNSMIQCCDYSCPNRDYRSGHCKVTACSKQQINNMIDIKTYTDCVNEMLIFPHTIGDITYYSKEELIKWVEDQQKINKDPNYGIGNWA